MAWTHAILLLFPAAAEPPVVLPANLANGGNGRLWDAYQQEVLARLAKPKSKRAEKRRKAKEAPARADVALVETLPQERPLEALVSDLVAERGRIDVLAESIGQIEARRAEAEEAERVRIKRKRNNEAALLLLAA